MNSRHDQSFVPDIDVVLTSFNKVLITLSYAGTRLILNLPISLLWFKFWRQVRGLNRAAIGVILYLLEQGDPDL